MAGTPPDHPERRTSQRRLPIALAALVLVLGAVLTFALVGGEDEAAGQTVRFQTPTEPGPDPFTKPADVRGKKKVEVGSGPFGGTGSDLVCDRELLIKSLRARPDRLRAWAETLGVEPNAQDVARYIRRLRAVTLTRDTRVTNHSFANGTVVKFQAILQAGTAVLVDKDGNPVARCRCGNPLADPIDYVTARCLACPADYKPPPPCDEWRDCYRRYPNPPVVITYRRRLHCYPPRSRAEFERCVEAGRLGRDDVPEATTPRDGPDVPGVARFNPPAGGPNDSYTLEVGDFDPNITLTISLTRPDGATESYSLRTDEFGNGSYTFPRVADAVPGTYRATVSGGGESASAATTVSGSSEAPAPEQQPEPEQSQQNPAGPEVGGGTDCNNPQSQDEIDLCGG